MKKVLVLCTGNSCRSIIAETLINAKLDGVEAKSAGVNPKGEINKLAKKVLQENGIWNDKYYSKDINEVINEDFDLVVTVCDNAKETCPVFPKHVAKIHIGFEDPDGKDYKEFQKTYKEIEEKLLFKIKKLLSSPSAK